MPDRVQAALYGGTFRTAYGASPPFVLPGELIEQMNQSQNGTPAVLEPSSLRREPGCVHFGLCGGCHYQHAGAPVQVEWKQTILAGLLAHAGLRNLPPIEHVSGPEWGYRNRIRLRLEPTGAGIRAGYNQRASNAFLPVGMCPIATPLLWRAAAVLVRLAASHEICRRWLQATAEVELFCTGDEQRLQMQLFLRNTHGLSTGRFTAFCQAVQAAVPELAGAGAALDPELNRRARQAWAGASWGADGLQYRVGACDYWVSRGAFFQVNRFLVEPLVKLVTEGLAGQTAWDLFAGVGLFARVLAAQFSRVIAVEGAEIAARDLAAAARKAGFEARRQPALDFLRGQEHQRERPEVVVLDPPRAGLGLEGAALLGRSGARQIVYVSCDPETLARDLAVLVRAGYILERITLIDLFPQTYHLETVVRLHLQT